MKPDLYDVLLTFLHLGVMGINLFAWIPRRTRRLHRVVVLLTAISWFVFGATRGWGYCFLTDWQWDVKRELGETNIPASFVHYLLHTRLGLPIEAFWTDVLTALCFLGVVVITLAQIFRERTHRTRS